MMLYRGRELIKEYAGRRVLDVREFEIERFSMHALVGANGAGKTTLLKLLAFLEPPSSGELFFDGRQVEYRPDRLLQLRRRVVLVEQHPILFTTTVAKNIAFGLKMRKVSRRQQRQLVEEMLDLVDLQGLGDKPAWKLSGGETQRVALARALVLSPEVLLCDEPTSSVDVDNQRVVLSLLKRINQEKKTTIIFTSHDRKQTAALGGQVIGLDHGRIIPFGLDNVFPVTKLPGEDFLYSCRLGKQTVPFNLPGITVSEKVSRLSLDPAGIAIQEGTSAGRMEEQLVFSGRLVSVSEEGRKIQLLFDVGRTLSVYLSGEKYKEIAPVVGKSYVLIPQPEAIRMFE